MNWKCFADPVALNLSSLNCESGLSEWLGVVVLFLLECYIMISPYVRALSLDWRELLV
jgi:hypothetical protein